MIYVERERERNSDKVYVCVREIERKGSWKKKGIKKRGKIERDRVVVVCVCVCERERERETGKKYHHIEYFH